MSQYEYDRKREESIAKGKIYCTKCGHSLLMGTQDKAICDWCDHYVFKDKKAEFKYRLKEQMLKK